MNTRFKCVDCCLWLALACVAGCNSAGPGGATLTYWTRVLDCSMMQAGGQSDARSQAVASLRARADAIQRLPTSGVDSEASRIGLTAARLLREQAVLVEQGAYLPAAAFVDGFVVGFTGEGNPFASTMEYGADVNAWGSRYQAWCNDAQVVRAQLTSKYGTEFPNLIRSGSSTAAPPANGPNGPSPPVAVHQSWWDKRNWFMKAVIIGGAILFLSQFFRSQKARGNSNSNGAGQ